MELLRMLPSVSKRIDFDVGAEYAFFHLVGHNKDK